jgi:hypothetical protein
MFIDRSLEEEATRRHPSSEVVRDTLFIHTIRSILNEPNSITSYGDRPNVYEDVSRYFRGHFVQLHERKDISKRTLFVVC